MRTTCRHCHKPLIHVRADAQYHPNCRVAAWRLRQVPPPAPRWLGHAPNFSSRPAPDGGLSREELGERLLEIAEREDEGEPKTGRRYYYLALSHGYVSPDMSATTEGKKSRDAAYDRVIAVLGALRMQGRLGWHMVLDLTRELVEWQTYRSPREAREDMRRNYDEDRWIGQPYYPTLIVEKDTLEPICKPIAQRWQMPFASSRGYGSLTLQHDTAAMFLRRHAADIRNRLDRTKQWPKVYFISDLDPSGLDLERTWKEVLAEFGVATSWERIALTLDQVRDPALDIERLSIGVKPSDSRSKAYIAQYGRRCWEADILPAVVIERDLDFHIGRWIDHKQWKRREAEIERARKLL
jgi:hypothetical protein